MDKEKDLRWLVFGQNVEKNDKKDKNKKVSFGGVEIINIKREKELVDRSSYGSKSPENMDPEYYENTLYVCDVIRGKINDYQKKVGHNRKQLYRKTCDTMSRYCGLMDLLHELQPREKRLETELKKLFVT